MTFSSHLVYQKAISIVSRNPLKLDPTRTALIRRQWAAATGKRFEKLRRTVWAYVITQNELGLIANVVNAPAKPFKFETDPAKIRRFRRWLQQQINDGILEIHPITGEPKGLKPWMYKYIDSAYKKGLFRAYTAAHGTQLGKKQPYYDGTREEFLRSAFQRGERTSKLELLYTRSYEDLKGVTSAMATQMSRVLTDGLAHGKHPLQVGRMLSRTITGMSSKRGKVIALTETIHAHAEGTLDGLEELGIDEVGAEVEFSNSHDDGVCPICEDLGGKVYTIQKARGVIPVHPRCRCAWLPVVALPKGVKLSKPM